jgi:hypothetical protein
MSSKVTTLEGSLVRLVKWVDEWVKTLTSGAVGDIVGSKDTGNLGGKLGTVLVEGKVAVGGVVWVDEGVPVGISWLLLKVQKSWGLSWPWGWLDWPWGWCSPNNWLLNDDLLLFLGVGDECSGIPTGGWDVGSIQDPESILASGVLDSVSLTIISNIGVLANPVAGSIRLLPENDLVLGGESGSGTAISNVESLLFQDLGILLVKGLAHGSSGSDSGKNEQFHHLEWIFGLIWIKKSWETKDF